MKHLLAIIVLLASFSCALAQESRKHAFFINFDQKIIYVDSLQLPRSINTESILKMLPELLKRPNESLASSYDIKVNGMSLGSSYKVALDQLKMTNIERIEVSESPLSTYENNGQGGTINIVLRTAPLKLVSETVEGKQSADHETVTQNHEPSLWGAASLGVLHPLDIMPLLQMNYTKKNFSIQGVTMAEFERYKDEETVTSKLYSSSSSQTCRNSNQFLGAFAKYNPSTKDAFEFKLMESYSHSRNDKETNTISLDDSQPDLITATMNNIENLDTVTTTQLKFLTNYKHQFSSRIKLEFETQYSYNRNRSRNADNTYLVDQLNNTHTLAGTLNMAFRLYQKTKNRKSPDYIDIKLGSDYSFAWDDIDYFEDKVDNMPPDNVSGTGRTIFAMPYLRWECRFRRFRMQAQGEFQTFNYNLNVAELGNDSYSHNNFTGSLIIEQGLSPLQYLRLYCQRRIKRPTTQQVFSKEIPIPTEMLILLGNSDLVPSTSNEVSLDYISRYNFGDNHFTIDVNGSYNHLSDIITYNTIHQFGMTQYGDMGYNKRSYYNDCWADVWSANLMVFYRYRNFSLSFAGNIFDRRSVKTDALTQKVTDWHYTYFNLSIMPAFSLKSGWNASLYLAYHSKVKVSTEELDDCALSQLNIGKSFGNLNIYFYQKSAITGNNTDISYGTQDTSDKYTSHTLVRSTVGIGIQYQF